MHNPEKKPGFLVSGAIGCAEKPGF